MFVTSGLVVMIKKRGLLAVCVGKVVNPAVEESRQIIRSTVDPFYAGKMWEIEGMVWWKCGLELVALRCG